MQTKMKQIIEQDLKPIMIGLFNRIKEGGLSLKVDGTPAYNPKAQFVGGKVINEACYTALEFIRTEESLQDLGEIIRMVAGMEMETWGILNGITGLYRLKVNGLLEKVVDRETLEILKKSMDWRTFVDVENHYALIHKPTNYYGVAFGIARYRELLGWEAEGHSTQLLNRLIEHIHRYSGELCFMDETPGDGRFDRYSILVPSELTALLLGTGWEVPKKIRTMLTKSAHIFLQLANEEGTGFAYGRSIGAYGDTAALEVFAAAAELDGVLTREELEIAYGYSMKLMKNMVDFWYDRDMDSVNMWENGRRTDSYRNKNRILGENLSLCMQVINSYEHWKSAGYEDHEICSDYAERLAGLDRYVYVPFADGEYKRGMAIVRDQKQIWSLPLINGGQKYYDKDAYMPVPFQNDVLQGVPECNHGQLVPQLIMESGAVYMPLAYTKEITHEIAEEYMAITCEYSSLCRMGNGVFISGESSVDNSTVDNSRPDGTAGKDIPQPVDGFCDRVRYVFAQNRIRREDIITISSQEKIREVRLVLLTYSEDPRAERDGVLFGRGTITGMSAEGYDSCTVKAAVNDGSYDTPRGRLQHEVVWSRKVAQECGELRLAWTIQYE